MFPWTDPAEPLRFDRFMAAALHDPERGYYARRIRGVGKPGDFTTTAAISPALGRAVAHWAADALRESSCRDLIELGPGEGTLASAIRRHLPWTLRLRTRLHLVESSVPLREKQQALLGRHARWHPTIASALEACSGRAVIYSNEFADAFPVRRFRRRDDGWDEQFVLPDRDHWRPSRELPDSTQFDLRWPEGQAIEVHESYREWLEAFLPQWKCGRMLTIDYGARDSELYHRQPAGSLRAYFHQQAINGPEIWSRPGHQDITADVNFSDLIRWAEPTTEMVELLPQEAFLRPFIDPGNPADHFASDPSGSGGAFLCLDQRRR
ncbi:MAG: SAM-dependent methyltransferase [Verrucomicrobiota bacterium]